MALSLIRRGFTTQTILAGRTTGRKSRVAWQTPEDELLAGETRSVILGAINALPEAQRDVLVLRDIEGLTGTEVCNILGLTGTHQRVLLHRARSRVRAAFERHFAAMEGT